MRFHEILNEYIKLFGCTAKEICDRSGMSAATLSRYRSGQRRPEADSEALDRLCLALGEIAVDKEIDLTLQSIRDRFQEAEDLGLIDSTRLMKNFDTLVSTLNINMQRLCRHINYDVSSVFRFRNGTRKPSDPERFASAVAGYVAMELDDAQTRTVLASLLDCEEHSLSDCSECAFRLTEWLLSGDSVKEDSVSSFLHQLDDFDLNAYIKSIHFDELKVPTVPFQIAASRSYFGLKEMMESELDFLKATVLSKSMEPVIMYSDMPMGEMAKDPEFPKKWMFGMAMMLKKGLHLNMIHNVDRSFDEMMLGLESYIPMYMTGQISPYYLKEVQNSVFLHFLKVSGAAALSGEAIAGYHSNGKYYLTKAKKEISYYSRRAKELLSRAVPLMDIYNSENANELHAAMIADAGKEGRRRSILSTLPIYTMEESLLRRILDRYDLFPDDRASILRYAAERKERIESILKTSPMEDEIASISESEFSSYPLPLDLSGAFCEQDIQYTYEEYREHLNSTKRFAETHPNYTLKEAASQAFRNLQVIIHEGKWAMISKEKAPTIHFMIHHPKLVDAIEKFIPPFVEEE